MIRPGFAAAGPLLALLTTLGALSGARLEAQAGAPFARVEVQLPGPLLSAAVVRLEDGEHRLAVLVGPPKKERNEEGEDEDSSAKGTPDAAPDEPLRTLLLVDPTDGRTERIETATEGLPESARRLMALPREGADDLLVVTTGGGALLVDPAERSGKPQDPADVKGSVLLPSHLSPDRAALLAVARPGTLELFRARPDGTLRATGALPLPKRAERTRWGVRVTSPPIHRIETERGAEGATTGGGSAPCWAVGPEAHGKRRLRTLLHCLGDEEQEEQMEPVEPTEPVEVWSLLPEGETVTETLYTRYRGRPLLVVLTRTKLGLFVKQHLRLFPLEASRNRVGTEPILATETACPLWRNSSLGFADVDGDGREDLYLVCEKGLVDQELRLEVYAALGDEGAGDRFEPRARSVDLDGEYSSWSFGSDWTGDGLPDLLAVQQGAIELHPGTGSRRRPVERSPARFIDLGPGARGEATDEEDELQIEIDAEASGDTGMRVRLGGPRVVGVADLTGDDRPELVVYRAGTPGGSIAILRRR